MKDERWLDPEERDAWVRFAAVLELLPASLDAQLSGDQDLTHFDYWVLAMLSEADGHQLRLTSLAARTNATLPRLSRVVSRLERQGLLERSPCPEDARATNAVLTDAGWAKIVEAAPGHVAHVRAVVVDALSREQIRQLAAISRQLLARLDPQGKMFASESPGV